MLDQTEGRGISFDLWSGFPVDDVLAGRNANTGAVVKPNLASFRVWADDSGTVVCGQNGERGHVENGDIYQLPAYMGGAVRWHADGTLGGQASVQWGGGAFVISSTTGSNRDLIFEAAVRQSYVDGPQDLAWFVGLAEPGSAVSGFATSGLADKDLIGVYSSGNATGAVDFVYRKSGSAIQTPGSVIWTIGTGWVHIGFEYDPAIGSVVPWYGTGDRTTSVMQPYKYGQVAPGEISSGLFPADQPLTPIVAVAGLLQASNLDVRLLACGQRAAAHRE